MVRYSHLLKNFARLVVIHTVKDAVKDANGDYSHEIKRCLPLGRKAMSNLDSMLKSRDFTLPTKVCLDSQSYGFSSSHVWM